MSLGRGRGHKSLVRGFAEDHPVHAVCSWVQCVTDPWLGKEWCLLVGYLSVPCSTLEAFAGFFPCVSRKLIHHKSSKFCFPISYLIEARLKDLPNVQSREVSSRLTVQIFVGWDSLADLHKGLLAEASSPLSQKPTSCSYSFWKRCLLLLLSWRVFSLRRTQVLPTF